MAQFSKFIPKGATVLSGTGSAEDEDGDPTRCDFESLWDSHCGYLEYLSQYRVSDLDNIELSEMEW